MLRARPGRIAGAVLAALMWALVATLLAVAGAPARADQDDARLDGLFERLHATAEGVESRGIEQEIWRIWLESGDPVVDRLMRQGIAAMGQRRLELALERFDRVVERAPGFAEGWNKRATVHYLMDDLEASVLDIERTLDLEPRHFGALSGLGLIYDAIDAPGAALRSFEAALEINPHLQDTRERIEALRRELRGRPT